MAGNSGNSVQPRFYSLVDLCVEDTLRKVGNDVVLAAPLGLGKPNQLINAFYHRAKNDPNIKLKIITALSLEKPQIKGDMESRFLTPFVERVFGDYVELEYMRDLRQNSVPANITISEFYFKAGSMKQVAEAQRHYISTNYTFVFRELLDHGVNVLVQLVAKADVDGQTMLSLSSNTDVTLDFIPRIVEAQRQASTPAPFLVIAQVHDQLPFMYNEAMVTPGYFDMVIESSDYNTRLFAPPNMNVPNQDFAAGLLASSLIRDGGTLQIGIGSLGDAITYACQMRHQHNSDYQNMLDKLSIDRSVEYKVGGTGVFDTGLYGSSEMFVNGFLHLIKQGIVKRKVYDHLALQQQVNQWGDKVSPQLLQSLRDAGVVSNPLSFSDVEFLQYWGLIDENVAPESTPIAIDDNSLSQLIGERLGRQVKHGIFMHAGFFLGPEDFYQGLRELNREENENIGMTSVGRANQLSQNYPLYREQRKHARFINTGMMVTLSGAVVSDALEDGTIISGVGGQYNFVAMAHELDDARSIICIRSTRGTGKNLQSNIVPYYGHTTIPRHLRDIVVTEYGIADLRGKTDEEIIQALLNICDSQFQNELMEYAKQHNKLNPDYEIPQQYRNNTAERINSFISTWRQQGFFPPFPLGSDFTDEEIALGRTLKELKDLQNNPKQFLRALLRSFTHKVEPEEAQRFLQRINLEHPNTAKETIFHNLILLELADNGYLKSI